MSSIKIIQPSGFSEAVQAHLINNSARVSSLDFEGQRYWIKQVEHVKGRLRVLKPAPKQGFKREVRAYEELLSIGAPVPECSMIGDQFVVFKDVGPATSTFWRSASIPSEKRAFVSGKAGEALSRLHALGVIHGRPVLRDICWDGEKVTFLDFENYSKHRNIFQCSAFDVLCFVHSICSQPVKDEAALTTAIERYRKNDNSNVWEEARALAHRLRWIEVLSRPFQFRKDPHAREFKSMPKVREVFLRAVNLKDPVEPNRRSF